MSIQAVNENSGDTQKNKALWINSWEPTGNNALYRTSDLLFEHKDQIERFLRMRSKQIFSLEETIILYDLTNTYFTGKASGYKRGRSKQKRNDCPLVTLGLVLDGKGFVKGQISIKEDKIPRH
jgi:hypothetical protein